MGYVLAGASMAAIAAFAGFLALVRKRWFARLQQGFLVALTLAVAGLALASTSLFGLWGYERGRAVLVQSLHDAMSNLADVIEHEVVDKVMQVCLTLNRMADELASREDLPPGPFLRAQLDRVQRFDPRLAQIETIDANGQVVASTSDKGRMEGQDPQAAEVALKGKEFVSDPIFSEALGRYVLTIGVPVKGESRILGAFIVSYDIQGDLGDVLRAARFGKTGNAVLVDDRGRIIAHPNPSRVGTDVSGSPAVQNAWKGESGWIRAPNNRGVERLLVYRPMPKVTTVVSKPWVFVAGIDVSEAFAPIHALTVQFLAGFAAIVLACVLLARQLASSIREPVRELVEFARRVGQGDLRQRVSLTGQDEMGQLGGALNQMVAGLEERDRVKEIFGRYVTTQLSEKILRDTVRLGGERRNLTVLISDIRDFTTMSETMPPEEVVKVLNGYFSEMVDAVFAHQGILDKFIGDGLLAVFGALEESPDHARRAVLTALEMKQRLATINAGRARAGKPPLAIGVGIHTADVVIGNIGSRRRLEYTVIGDGVNTCSRIESLNKEFGTTILITESTYAGIGDEFVCRPMPEAHLKGKSHAPRVFEVLQRRTEDQKTQD